MPLRLPTKRFSTFLAFNSCTRQALGAHSRTLCQYRARCLQLASTPASSRRPGDKRSMHATNPCRASPKNPYEVLGLKPDANAAEIKKTYFALARKYHPDTNPDKGARDKFVEIQDAYDILKDEKKRASYDQYGSASQNPGFDPNGFSDFSGFGRASGGFSGFGGFSGGSHGQRASGDLFEQLFNSFGGQGGARARPNALGDDIRASLTVNFLEACKGTKKKVTITPINDCSTCSATGLKSGVERTTCSTCKGTGSRTFVIDNGFQMASTCQACGGIGTTIPRGGECSPCGGAGKVRTKQTISVTIPAGAEEGMNLRVSGAGDAPLVGKGQKGDLYIRLNVTSSPFFTRQGANLYHQARIPFHRALLGGIVRVPTLDGEVDVRIPGGTQQGEEMVLKGRGVSYVNSVGHGDLFVKFALQLPRSLTKRQKELLEEYAADVENRAPGSKPAEKGHKEPLSTDNVNVTATKKEGVEQKDEETNKEGKRATA